LCHFAVFRLLSSSYKSQYCYIHLHFICPKQVKCNRLCCLGFDDMSLSNCFLDILDCFFEISRLIYPALPHHIPEKVSSTSFPRKLQDWQVRWRLSYVRKERPVVTFKFFTVVLCEEYQRQLQEHFSLSPIFNSNYISETIAWG
jgi:hypothetical protein